MNDFDPPGPGLPGEPAEPHEALPQAMADLHALVDGQLPPERLQAVLAQLRTQPEQALQVLEWQAQRQALRRLARTSDLAPLPQGMAEMVDRLAAGAPQASSAGLGSTPPAAPAPTSTTAGPVSATIAPGMPVPPLREERRRHRPAWHQALAASLLMLAGGLVGAFVVATHGSTIGIAASAEPAFARQALAAHAVYTPESRHPVEVGAAEEAHLVAWLSRRLGSKLKVPALQDQGFRLLGGRLLAGEDNAPRAQFMYEDLRGRRLTLLVTRFDDGRRPTEVSFRSLNDGPIESFYWVEGSFGYALSAPLPAAEVMALARSVYRQLAVE